MSQPHLHSVTPKPSAGRVPPNDLDAEAAVLSAMMLDAAAIETVAPILAPKHFYSTANREIFEAAVELAKAGQPADVVTVAAILRRRERLAAVGGAEYVARICDATPAVGNVGTHASIVRERWRQRAVIASCQRLAAEGYGDVGALQEWIDGAENELHEIGKTNDVSGPRRIHEIMRESWTQITEAAERGDVIFGARTGLEALDAKLHGLQPGHLIVLAGRPGMGKSSLAFGIAAHAAAQPWPSLREGKLHQQPTCVAVFSLEMCASEVTNLIALADANVSATRMQSGQLVADEWQRLTASAAHVSSLPLWVDDTPGLTPLALRARVRRLRTECEKKGGRLGLVVVDHLLLMRADIDSRATRDQQVGEITRSLKELAKECEVPVLALCQLNRGVESRTVKNKRPTMADLRDSGNIEQDADEIIMIYRDDYYDPETRDPGIAELNVVKQRAGAGGLVRARWHAHSRRFEGDK